MDKEELIYLGYCIQNFENIDFSVVSEKHFSNTKTKKLYSYIFHCWNEGKQLDFLQMQKISGIQLNTLNTMINETPTLFDFEQNTKKLKEKYVRSTLLKLSEFIKEKIDTPDIQELRDYSSGIIDGIDFATENIQEESMEQLINTLPERMEIAEKAAREGKFIGLKTGLRDVDEKIRGFKPGELVVIAARPSMGKSTFALNILTNLAFENIPSVFFSYEMTSVSLMNKILARQCGIPDDVIENGYYTNEQKPKIIESADFIKELPIYFVDKNLPKNSPAFFRKTIKQMVKKHGIQVVVIDHLTLAVENVDPVKEISRLTGALKQIANDFGITVIAISQLSRAVEKREDKRPILSDLRDSGSIEQDASKVIFLYRDSYYKKDFDDGVIDLTEVHIAKNRYGKLGTAQVGFHKEISEFKNVVQNPNVE